MEEARSTVIHIRNVNVEEAGYIRDCIENQVAQREVGGVVDFVASIIERLEERRIYSSSLVTRSLSMYLPVSTSGMKHVNKAAIARMT